jgi:tetratricopeptide (TPR) repeat protein
VASPAAAFRNLKEGAQAPEFTLKSSQGQDVSLGSFKGKAVVVAFVRQGQEKSEKVLQALASLDAAVTAKAQILVVVANPAEGDAGAWASKVSGSLMVLLDPGEEVYGKYGVMVSPSTGVIKADGSFMTELAGYSAAYKDELEGVLKVGLGLATAEEVKAAAEKGKVGDTPDARKAAERELDKARLLVQRKMKDKALEPAKQAVASDDTYAPAHAFLGRLLLDASDANADEAMAHFEKALQLAPRDVDAKVGAARVKALKGDVDGAVALLEEATKLNPKPERVYYQLGLIYEKAGKNEKAAEAYRKALEKLVGE